MGTTPIECVDCGTVRQAPNASAHLIKRCKSCQDEYNRQRALERYYQRTGRKKKEKKKKTPKKSSKKSSKKGDWLVGPGERTKELDKDPERLEEVDALIMKIHNKMYPGTKCFTVDDW